MPAPLRQGFSYVEVDGCVSFRSELEKDSWGKHSIAAWTGDSPGPELLEAPLILACKVRLWRSTSRLVTVMQQVASAKLPAIDARWDSLQRRMHYRTAEFAESTDTDLREAALRVRTVGLLGDGTQQTGLSYKLEVDFGRRQVALAREKPLALDIALLGLVGLVEDIAASTEELASAVDLAGTGEGSLDSRSRSERLLSAKTECRQAFSAVQSELEWVLAQPETTAEKKAAIGEYLTPIYALLERYSRVVLSTEEAKPTLPETV
jgi:hypothetical protein